MKKKHAGYENDEEVNNLLEGEDVVRFVKSRRLFLAGACTKRKRDWKGGHQRHT